MTVELVSIICQIAIPFTGLLASYLVASQSPNTRMWAGVAGLVGEPFWLVSAWLAGQWGVMVLAVFYAGTWGRVCWVNYQEVVKN